MDTRDLIERREELKERVLADFQETFPHYEVETYEEAFILDNEEIVQWWSELTTEIEEIEAIDNLENEIGSEFSFGVWLVKEGDFEDYCKELLEDCGYLDKDFPTWIEIDWTKTTNNMKVDYSITTLQGEIYLYRA